MRLTKVIKGDYYNGYYTNGQMSSGVVYINDNKDFTNAAIYKLGQLEDIEEEFGINLLTLFDSKYTSTMYEMELEKDDKTIYFDGDSFYGHYSAKDFLKLIKDMLSMYKQLIKLGH